MENEHKKFNSEVKGDKLVVTPVLKADGTTYYGDIGSIGLVNLQAGKYSILVIKLKKLKLN
ncbi:MAG: hypothetical protein P4L34_04380 [Paludibacter sp.]|nr:hypothetical protein [Paludibacter sp.]